MNKPRSKPAKPPGPKRPLGRPPEFLEYLEVPTGRRNPDGSPILGADNRPEIRRVQKGQAIAEAVASGCTYGAAAEMHGVPEGSFYRWMAHGRDDDEAGKASPYREFRESVTRACARSEAALLAEIRKLCREKGDARTLLDLLGRRFPERWGRPDLRVELTGKDGEALIPPEVAERAIAEAATRIAERKAGR